MAIAPVTIMDETSFKRYFPGANWVITVDGAHTKIGCFWLSVRQSERGYFSSAACFVVDGLAPVYESSDMYRGLDDAIALLSHWCHEQGELMVAAVSPQPLTVASSKS